jgi:hypothetical protein
VKLRSGKDQGENRFAKIFSHIITEVEKNIPPIFCEIADSSDGRRRMTGRFFQGWIFTLRDTVGLPLRTLLRQD